MIKSIDGVLGTRTQGSRMVGTDESTELWRHPKRSKFYSVERLSGWRIKGWIYRETNLIEAPKEIIVAKNNDRLHKNSTLYGTVGRSVVSGIRGL